MNLSEIQDQVKRDLKINDLELDIESLRIPSLHIKYLQFLTENSLKLKKANGELAVLKRNKWIYYTGKASEDVYKEKDFKELLVLSQDKITDIEMRITDCEMMIKQLIRFTRKLFPETTIVSGGGWSTYNPDEIIQLVPEIDMVCVGEGEETFSEIYDEVNKGTKRFDKIKGLCVNQFDEIKYTEPRALISDLDTVPYPHYDLYELDIYFKYSSYPISREAFNILSKLSSILLP